MFTVFTVTASQIEWAIETINVDKKILFAILDNTTEVDNAAKILWAMDVVSNSTYFIDIKKALNIVVDAREAISQDGIIHCVEKDITCGDAFYGTVTYVVDVMKSTTTYTDLDGKVTTSEIKPEECKAALVWYNDICEVLN